MTLIGNLGLQKIYFFQKLFLTMIHERQQITSFQKNVWKQKVHHELRYSSWGCTTIFFRFIITDKKVKIINMTNSIWTQLHWSYHMYIISKQHFANLIFLPELEALLLLRTIIFFWRISNKYFCLGQPPWYLHCLTLSWQIVKVYILLYSIKENFSMMRN